VKLDLLLFFGVVRMSTERPQLALVRLFVVEADGHLASGTEFGGGLAISLMQDAAELLTRLALKEHGLSAREPASLDQLIAAIDGAPKELALQKVLHKNKIYEVNKARVNFKHLGITPVHSDAIRLCAYANQFLEAACLAYFGTSFEEVSSLDFLRDRAVRDFLKVAETELSAGRILESSIASKRAYGTVMAGLKSVLPVPDASLRSLAGAFGDNVERRAIESGMRYLTDYLGELRTSILIASLAVDSAALAAFRNRPPTVVVTIGGHVTSNLSRPLTEADARENFSFALDFARRVDRYMAR
jgi:hypothetical protein